MTVTVSSKRKDFEPYNVDGWRDLIQIYKSGMGTRDLARFIENMFGSHYSPTTVSITTAAFEVFKNWQVRPMQKRYASFT